MPSYLLHIEQQPWFNLQLFTVNYSKQFEKISKGNYLGTAEFAHCYGQSDELTSNFEMFFRGVDIWLGLKIAKQKLYK